MKKKIVFNSLIFILFFLIGMFFFRREDVGNDLTRILVQTADVRFDSVGLFSVPFRKLGIQNTGKNTLILDHVRASCDCVEVGYSRKLIPPGGTDTLYIRINTAVPGPVRENVWIYCNVAQSPLKIRVSGYVVKEEGMEIITESDE